MPPQHAVQGFHLYGVYVSPLTHPHHPEQHSDQRTPLFNAGVVDQRAQAAQRGDRGRHIERARWRGRWHILQLLLDGGGLLLVGGVAEIAADPGQREPVQPGFQRLTIHGRAGGRLRFGQDLGGGQHIALDLDRQGEAAHDVQHGGIGAIDVAHLRIAVLAALAGAHVVAVAAGGVAADALPELLVTGGAAAHVQQDAARIGPRLGMVGVVLLGGTGGPQGGACVPLGLGDDGLMVAPVLVGAAGHIAAIGMIAEDVADRLHAEVAADVLRVHHPGDGGVAVAGGGVEVEYLAHGRRVLVARRRDRILINAPVAIRADAADPVALLGLLVEALLGLLAQVVDVEFGEHALHLEHRPAHRRGKIHARLCDGHEGGIVFAHHLNKLQQQAQVAHQAVGLVHDDRLHPLGDDVGAQPLEGRALGVFGADAVVGVDLVDLPAAPVTLGTTGPLLGLQAVVRLILSADAGIDGGTHRQSPLGGFAV